MSSVITAPTYDPTSTATALAQKTTSELQAQLTNQTNAASATAKALTTLGSAISLFQSSLSSLAGPGKSLLAQSATLSDNAFGSATANSRAATGTYSLFVKQVATASQVSYNGLADGAGTGGTLKVTLANESVSPASTTASFSADLSAKADTDGDGTLSIREVAAAINSASGNTGLVSAGVVTVSPTDVRLTSKNTGMANTVSLDPSAVADATLKTGLGTRVPVTNAQDAIIQLGGSSGAAITQGSNTFTNIDGVSLTVTKAQNTGDNPIMLTVASDSNGTAANAQAFVTAYNKLKSALDSLLDPGSPTGNTTAGTFAHDSGVKVLQSQLVNLLRPVGSLSLASYGITASRDGTLALDSAKLTRQLAINPTGLDQLMGSASASGSSGVLGALNTYLNQWSNAATGQIQERTTANTKLQSDLSKRQDELDTKYNAAYQRYLQQFTALQTLQATMNSNVSIFDAVFGSDKSS